MKIDKEHLYLSINKDGLHFELDIYPKLWLVVSLQSHIDQQVDEILEPKWVQMSGVRCSCCWRELTAYEFVKCVESHSPRPVCFRCICHLLEWFVEALEKTVKWITDMLI